MLSQRVPARNLATGDDTTSNQVAGGTPLSSIEIDSTSLAKVNTRKINSEKDVKRLVQNERDGG